MRALIVCALVCLMGCAFQEGEGTKDNSNMQPTSTGQGSYSPGSASPSQLCSAASHLIINTPEGPVVVDIPANCNPTIGPDRGDPAPDYASDPNPWENKLGTPSIKVSAPSK